MSAPTLYGDPASGNCLKVKWVAAHLGIPTVWKTISVIAGDARTADFLAVNPAGKVPVLVLEDGTVLSESNAIMIYLAEGSALIPADAVQRAQMLQWMFWEQYSHEPNIATRRYRLAFLRQAESGLDPGLLDRGHAALARMQAALQHHPFIVGHTMTLADIALVAYTRMAHEGGFALSPYPAIGAWIGRVEADLGIGRYHPEPAPTG